MPFKIPSKEFRQLSFLALQGWCIGVLFPSFNGLWQYICLNSLFIYEAAHHFVVSVSGLQDQLWWNAMHVLKVPSPLNKSSIFYTNINLCLLKMYHIIILTTALYNHLTALHFPCLQRVLKKKTKTKKQTM